MSEEFHVVKADADDLEEIAQIAMIRYPANFPGDNPQKEAIAWMESKYPAIHNAENRFVEMLIAISNEGANKPVAGYTLSETTAAGYGVVRVLEWGVHPDFGRKGIGTLLIRETIDHWTTHHPETFENPMQTMLVMTGEAGVRLCERLGFEVDGISKGLYRSPGGVLIDEYTMRKDFVPMD